MKVMQVVLRWFGVARGPVSRDPRRPRERRRERRYDFQEVRSDRKERYDDLVTR